MSVLVLAVGSFTIIGASAMAPLISEALGLSEVGVGAIASVAYFGALLTAPLAGRLTDRSGPARVILLGLLALAVGNLVAGLAWHAVVLYVGILVAGFGYGAVNPATTVLSNPATARRRGLVMSIKQAGVPAGGIVAGAVLPVLAQAFGWRWAFALSMLVCLIVALGIRVRGGYVVQGARRSAIPHRPGRRLRLPIGYAFGLMIAGVQVSIFAFTAVYLVDVRGFSTSSAGLGVSTLLVGGVMGRLFWGWLSDLFPRHRLLTLEGISLLGAVFLVGLLVAPNALVPLALVCLGVCSVGWNGVYIAVVAESTDPHRVGRSMGAALALINAGAIAFPIAIGALVAWTSSWAAGLLALAGLSLLATIVARISSEVGDSSDVVVDDVQGTAEGGWG
ncbi:MAG: MFS transporter [Candidatus Nanopelagicales bacterium]